MTEDFLLVLKLCSLLSRLQAQELRLARAQYRVAYFKKIRRATTSKKSNITIPDGFHKWKDRLGELNAEIERARLKAIEAQGNMLALKSKMHSSLVKALDDSKARIVFENGKTVGVTSRDGSFISSTQFPEMADQYVATTVLNQICEG